MTVLLAVLLAAIGPPPVAQMLAPGEPRPVAAAVAPHFDPAPDSHYDQAEWVPTWAVDIFDRLALCESTGRWNLNEGRYDGGHQYLPSTWTAWKRDSYPAFAWQATREQQMETTWRLTDHATDFGPFPGCARKLGLPR